MRRPCQNLNPGPCPECDVTDTVELAYAGDEQEHGAIVRWCCAGHVTVINEANNVPELVYNFGEYND